MNAFTNSPAVQRHIEAIHAAREAEKYPGITAYSRANGSYVTIREDNQNGECVYTVTHIVLNEYRDSEISGFATFTRRTRPTLQGLKQLAAKALKS